jgi:ParB family chromosome partitioning protein
MTTKKRSKKAFDEKRGTVFLFDPDDLVIIGLDTEHKEGEHALWDKRIKKPLTEESIANVDFYGIINPVTITKEDGKAIVVAGRGRVRRAREAKKRQKARGEPTIKVPCVMRNGDEGYLMGVMVSENEVREDNDMGAKIGLINRMSDRGRARDEIARDFGVTTKTIENWLALGSANRTIQDAAAAGAISTTAAVKLARLPAGEQAAALAETLTTSGGKSTTAAARRVAGRAKRGGASAETDGVGVTGRKAQRKMLEIAMGAEGDETDDYYEGAADTLRLILGEKPKHGGKAKKMLKGIA